MTDLLNRLAADPWIASHALAFLAGAMAYRRMVRWTLGGRA